jgi:hypothetical protein
VVQILLARGRKTEKNKEIAYHRKKIFAKFLDIIIFEITVEVNKTVGTKYISNVLYKEIQMQC